MVEPQINKIEILNETKAYPTLETSQFDKYKMPKPIFIALKKNDDLIDRFNIPAQDYLEFYKIHVYLQDVVKILIERKEEKPNETLVDYFNLCNKGEHVLLRDFQFINATPYNRKCLINEVKNIFNNAQSYSSLSALDYHLMISLLCADFPRSIILEAIQVVPKESEIQNDVESEDPLFITYSYEHLQRSFAFFFYFSEFIEELKKIFQKFNKIEENNDPTFLDIESEIELKILLSHLQSLLKSLKCPVFPKYEALLEVLSYKSELKDLFNELSVILPEDIINHIHGKITYKEFVYLLIVNQTIYNQIYVIEIQKNLTKLQDKAKDLLAHYSQIYAQANAKKQKKKKKQSQ